MAAEHDIPMSIKMNNKCFPGIADLKRGERIDEQQILDLLDFIDKRLDCADFRLICVLRTLYDFPHLLSKDTLARMKQSVLGFKYWMDESGEDSMCTWSENHQLIFATCEYLAAQLYPDAIFTNDGRKGSAHLISAKARLDGWLEQRFHLGFLEWHSNTYYEEDVAPLSLLMDCSRDEALRRKAQMLMDLLLLDMALHSFQGWFAASSGRCYEAQKKDPRRQDTLDIARRAFGLPDGQPYDYTRLSSDFILNRSYRLPGVIRRIAHSRDTAEIKTSMGLALTEIGEHFPDPQDIPGRGMYLWSMEAFTNPESVNLTLQIFRAWRMHTNDFLKNLRIMDMPILKQLGLMPWVLRLLNPVTQGIAIQRANTYTFKTAHYMLSTAQAYHPGSFGDQQHIWQATLPGPISVFTTHPGAAFFEDNARNFSPSYWVGNGIHPFAAQHRAVTLCLYDLRVRRGLMEKKRQMFSHAWFPADCFDQTILEPRIALGRKGDSYLALLPVLPMEQGEANELIQRGPLTGWAIMLGSRDEQGDFAAFVRLAREARLTGQGRSMQLDFEGHVYRIEDFRAFLVDGEEQPLEYKRLESPYGSVERNASEYIIEHEGQHLRLNLPELAREASQEAPL